jgi:hypothetical protein
MKLRHILLVTAYIIFFGGVLLMDLLVWRPG